VSVHPHGKGWQVRYRDENGKQRGKTFKLKGEATAWEADLIRRRRLGPTLARQLIDKPEAMTLAAFVKTGFRTHAVKRSQRTREQYQWALNNHLQELLDEPLHALDVPRLDEHQTFLLEHGRTIHTTRVALTMLSGILQVAVDHGVLPANPVRSLRKVEHEPKPDVIPLSPVELERLIASLTGRSRVIAVLGGHLGLSPIEVRHAEWARLTHNKLTIPAAATKRQRARTRVIAVPDETLTELRRWRLESGGRAGPIIGPCTDYALKQWGQRTLKPKVAQIAGLDASLYTLRHSHASALHYCAFTVPAAARRLGHAPALHLRYYAHVIDTLEGEPKFADLDALIAWARSESSVRTEFPKAGEK
jgi:hypothetical protein